MAMQRRRVSFRGHVQGVGFRYTTCQIARRFPVTGTVCNLGDGSVQLIAEGEKTTLDTFIQEIEQAMAGRIRECHQESGESLGEFDGFSIVSH